MLATSMLSLGANPIVSPGACGLEGLNAPLDSPRYVKCSKRSQYLRTYISMLWTNW